MRHTSLGRIGRRVVAARGQAAALGPPLGRAALNTARQ